MANKHIGELGLSEDKKLPNGQTVMNFHLEKGMVKQLLLFAKDKYQGKYLEELPLNFLPPGCRLKINGLAQISINSKINKEALIAMFVGEALVNYANLTTKECAKNANL